jgi:hypothetical protein
MQVQYILLKTRTPPAQPSMRVVIPNNSAKNALKERQLNVFIFKFSLKTVPISKNVFKQKFFLK